MSSLPTITLCLLVFCNVLPDSVRKFDEYGDIPFSEEKARLDNLAIYLQQAPDFIGWYVIHAGRRACVEEARSRAIRAKNYLVSRRGIRPDRLMWIDGGYREQLLVETWALPRSIGSPDASPSLDKSEVQIIKDCKSNYFKR